jgi:hypothetical protein
MARFEANAFTLSGASRTVKFLPVCRRMIVIIARLALPRRQSSTVRV